MKVGLCKTKVVDSDSFYKEYNISSPSGEYLGVIHVTDYQLSFDLTVDGQRFSHVLTYSPSSNFDYRRYLLAILQEFNLDPQFNNPIEQDLTEQTDE